MLAPICLFTYNRLWETQQSINALKNNYLASESDLFIFSDGPKNEESVKKVEAVREYIRQVFGFKSIKLIESSYNKGLAKSIISGVTQILEEYDKVIILEDDLLTKPNFLNFMNQALDYYSSSKNIRSVNGFSLVLKNETNQIYFQKRPFPWGWATWKNRWEADAFNKEKILTQIREKETNLTKFRKECGDDISKMLLNSIHGINNSWYVRWVYFHFRTNTFSVYPLFSFVENIGFSENATHCKTINTYLSKSIIGGEQMFVFIPFKAPNEKSKRDFLYYFSYKWKIVARARLLKSSAGRFKVFNEIQHKLKLKLK